MNWLSILWWTLREWWKVSLLMVTVALRVQLQRRHLSRGGQTLMWVGADNRFHSRWLKRRAVDTISRSSPVCQSMFSLICELSLTFYLIYETITLKFLFHENYDGGICFKLFFYYCTFSHYPNNYLVIWSWIWKSKCISEIITEKVLFS